MFLDAGRAATLRKECFFQALGHHAAFGPKRIVLQERAVFSGFAIAVTKTYPFNELLADRVGDRRLEFAEALHAVGVNGCDGLLDTLRVLLRGRVIANWRQRCVKLGDVFGFLLHKLRRRALVCAGSSRPIGCDNGNQPRQNASSERPEQCCRNGGPNDWIGSRTARKMRQICVCCAVAHHIPNVPQPLTLGHLAGGTGTA